MVLTQDRSSEFFALCQSLPPSTSAAPQQTKSTNVSGRYTATSTVSRNDPYSELQTFHKTASNLSKEIYSTSTLLSELTRLIHSRSGSLFVDDSAKVNSLVLQIKSNIESLNSKLDEANDMIRRNKRRLGSTSQAGQEASNLVGQLQEEFMNTTKGFKEVLKIRSDRMKERSDKKNDLFGIDTETSVDRDGFGGDNDQLGSLLGNKPKVYDKQNNNGQAFTFHSRANQETSSLLGGANLLNGPMLDLTSVMLAKEKDTDGNMPVGESSMQLPRPYGTPSHNVSGPGMRLRHSNSTDLPTYSGSYSSYSPYSKNDQSTLPVYTPLDIQRMEEESGQSQMMQLIPDQSYLRERADAMSQVESNIVELGTIFNKLAVMVSEHQEMVQRVEDNVDSANDNINLSLAALSDTLTNLRTNKALFLKVFTVLVVFIILFISFFA